MLKPNNLQPFGGEVGTTYNRPHGQRSEQQIDSVQQQVLLPKFRRSKLLHSGLVKREQLCMPTDSTSSLGFVAHNTGKSSGDNNCTQVGLGSMVADATPYSGQLYSSASGSDVIRKGFLRGGGTVEEPKLAVPSSKSSLVSKLLMRAQSLSRKSVSEDWNRRLNKAWNVYKGYCEIMRLTALPAEVDILVSFLVWLDLTHFFSGYVDFLAAVSREHLECHFSDPSKDYRVKRICKALVKEYKKDNKTRWPCDPLTVSTLRLFVDKKPQCTSKDLWIRDAALVAIGLRTMRRPGELCKLKFKDVKFGDKLCWVRISSSKTEQFANGTFIPIEYTDSQYCPVRLLRRYLKIRQKLWRINLFSCQTRKSN